MSLAITSTAALLPAVTGAAPAAAATAKNGEFASLLANAVNGVDQYRHAADQAVENLLTAESGELHTVALSAQRAELAFELGLQIRNKVVQAYQEIMRMQM